MILNVIIMDLRSVFNFETLPHGLMTACHGVGESAVNLSTMRRRSSDFSQKK